METITEPPVTFTKSALTEIKKLMNKEHSDSGKLLRVGVKGGGCSGLSYVLAFEQKEPADEIFEAEDVRFIVNPSHAIYLSGMQIEWEEGLNSRGFTFRNPNASKTCGCGTSFAV